MLCILKALVAWVILMFVSTNLIGFIVRSFFSSPPSVDDPTDRVRELLAHESKRLAKANSAITIVSIAVALVFLGSLYYFSNILLALAAFLAMLSRLPDLVWEIQTGMKVTRGNSPKGAVYIAATALLWLSLPITWFALCKWPS